MLFITDSLQLVQYIPYHGNSKGLDERKSNYHSEMCS